MLPQTYELPAAMVLVLAGALACFAGYRFFRYVLAIFGFLLGAFIASSTMGISNNAGMVIAAIVGGLVGAAILMLVYFLGIALLGAALGALLVAPLIWPVFGTGDPPWPMVVGLAVAGAIGAMFVQRHVIIVMTAFVGAFTLILGMLTAAERDALAGKAASSNWIPYLTTAFGHAWFPYAWVVLGLAGTAVQLSFKGKKKG